MGTVVVGVTVRADGARTEVVVERATTVEAVVAGINSLIYLCPHELRATALREVGRLAGPAMTVTALPAEAVVDHTPGPYPDNDDDGQHW
jgi:hypothetical protein